MRLNQGFAFYLRPQAPFNFELTVKKPAGWPLFTPLEIYEDRVIWTALELNHLLVGLRLSSSGTVTEPRVSLEVYTEKPFSLPQKLEVEKSLAAKLSVENNLVDFYRFAKNDPILKHAIDDLYGLN